MYKTGHAGVEHVLTDLRRGYWTLKGRKLVKKIVYQCITCRKLRGKTEVQQMASLPESRVAPFEPPFTIVGLDYIHCEEGILRSKEVSEVANSLDTG